MHSSRFAAVGLIAAVSLAGCAAPPALTIASLAVSGVSLAITGKTGTDEALSVLTDQDCSTFRVLNGDAICRDKKSKVLAAAALPPTPPEPAPAIPTRGEVVLAAAPLRITPASATPHSLVALAPAPPAPTREAHAEPKPAASVVTPPQGIAKADAPAKPDKPPEAPAAPVAAAPPAIASAPPDAPVAAPKAPTPRPTDMPARHFVAAPESPPPQAARAPPAGGPNVHAELVIQSVRDEAEARALAAQLRGYAAKVRPVQQGNSTVYEIVVGLSG